MLSVPSHGTGSINCVLKGMLAALTGGEAWEGFCCLSSSSVCWQTKTCSISGARMQQIPSKQKTGL